MSSFNTLTLIGFFAIGSIATWIAGVYLSRTTDALDLRWKLGDALGGMLLLSIAGSLPELGCRNTSVRYQHSGIDIDLALIAACQGVLTYANVVMPPDCRC